MQFATYNNFLRQIVLLKPEIRNVKAAGTDGEVALYSAVKDVFPHAVQLRCLKHIRDSVERKLSELQLDKMSTQEILGDIFGTTTDHGKKELGLSDADDRNDFFTKLMKLKKRWNDLESMHRRFLKNEKHDSAFYDWFCANYSDVFAENVVRSVRINAGLGNPPDAFYNNRSESMNRLLKSHVGHRKSSLPQFVRYLHSFVTEQFNNIKKANMSVGDWRQKGDDLATPQLSCSYRDILDSMPKVDEGILDAIWTKAAELVHSEGYITPIPGQPLSKGRMVASTTSSQPHIVIMGSKNESALKCDKNCPRYSAYNFCSHTVAVAETHGFLDKFIEQLKKGKQKINLSALTYHGLPDGAGEKGGKPKPKRRRTSKNVSDLTVVDRFASSSSQVTRSSISAKPTQQLSVVPSLPSPSAQPYYVKLLNGHIKVCAGCKLGYANRDPPFDICIVHQETRPIPHPTTKEVMHMPVNVHYHASRECIQCKDPRFRSTLVVVPDELKEKVTCPIYQTLFTQEFGFSFT